jgi:hypothetical protein
MLIRSVYEPASALLAQSVDETPGNGLAEHLVAGIQSFFAQ